MDSEYDLIVKIVLVGDSGVGKSNILSRFTVDQFNVSSKSTIGVEFATKLIEINGMSLKFQIWDTAGQERYKAITSAYYRNSCASLIVYDITKEITFENVTIWLKEVRNNVDDNSIIYLIGNKTDLNHLRVIAKSTGLEYAKNNNIEFFETSALKSDMINEMFQSLAEEFSQKYKKLENNRLKDLSDLSDPNDPKNPSDLSDFKNLNGNTNSNYLKKPPIKSHKVDITHNTHNTHTESKCCSS